MPRAARPAAPTGGNRMDLLTPPTIDGPGQPNGQPITAPTGLPYGESGELQGAQRAVPLPGPTTTPSAPSAPPGGLTNALDAARQMQKPDLPDLMRGTERPGEPITAGLPAGPPPVQGSPQPQQATGSMASMLTRMASATGSAALSQLAARAAAVGQ